MPFTTDMHDTSAPNAATPVLLAEDLSFSWPGSTTACLDIHRLALNAGEHVLLLAIQSKIYIDYAIMPIFLEHVFMLHLM